MASSGAPKIAFFRSTGQLQRSNPALSQWHQGVHQCHNAETKNIKATQQDCMERTSKLAIPTACRMRP